MQSTQVFFNDRVWCLENDMCQPSLFHHLYLLVFLTVRASVSSHAWLWRLLWCWHRKQFTWAAVHCALFQTTSPLCMQCLACRILGRLDEPAMFGQQHASNSSQAEAWHGLLCWSFWSLEETEAPDSAWARLQDKWWYKRDDVLQL